MTQIFHYDHCSFLVESRSRPGEFHHVEFHELPPHSRGFTETCTCETFTIHIPHYVKLGKIPNTVVHRRCFHIRTVREALSDTAIAVLHKTDPSRIQTDPRHASTIQTTKTGEKEFTLQRPAIAYQESRQLRP